MEWLDTVRLSTHQINIQTKFMGQADKEMLLHRKKKKKSVEMTDTAELGVKDLATVTLPWVPPFWAACKLWTT